ncbi:MAG: macro domain-containing protein, partial [Atopobiaceae bacterium]|nr:macro domain-containing protein [Atopobiaceae bacterium]
MPFAIMRDDITHVKADALVNAANEQLRQGGGVCGAIFEAAGAERLQKACDKIGHCDTGSAVATRAYRLPAKYVIHAVGPIWRGGTHGERELLASCYRSSLRLAAKLGCRSIAFPLISAGIYGYPKREALEVARHEVQAFLRNHEMDIKLVLFDADAVSLADDLQLRVQHYIDDVYVGIHTHRLARQRWEMGELFGSSLHDAIPKESASIPAGDYSMDDLSMPDAPGAAPSAPAAADRLESASPRYSMPTYGAAPAEAAP